MLTLTNTALSQAEQASQNAPIAVAFIGLEASKTGGCAACFSRKPTVAVPKIDN